VLAPEVEQSLSECEKFESLLNAAIEKHAGRTGRVASGPADGVADVLEKLWRLKESGALSDSEFEAQKAKILGDQLTN
jgi:hypothetical protein